MKISLNWIKHITSVPEYSEVSLDAFSHTYTTYTADVEWIERYIFDDRIVVWMVEKWMSHPDSDKLWIVSVDAGKCWKHEIVCGAQNVKFAKYVPLALENAILPGGLTISRRAIRGVESCGMICSQDELALQSERAEGIFPLETVWEESILAKHLGKPFGHLSLSFPWISQDIHYEMNDVIFDLDNKFITNRPDLFSNIGNAREIACIEKNVFDNSFLENQKFDVLGNGIQINIESDLVKNYFLTEYNFTEIIDTPFVIQLILTRSNQGLHWLIPDITNLVLTEYGQPSHAFDRDKIVWGITIRMARSGENMTGLDNKLYQLSTEDLVIVDEEKVLAIAGVIGGLSSSVDDTTKHIYIETATFDAVAIRKTSQRLWIRTDSSVRFEKWTDWMLPVVAQRRIEQLLRTYTTDLNKVSSFAHTTKKDLIHISISREFLESKIGIGVDIQDARDILVRLGFVVQGDIQTWILECTVPSWRATGDISIQEDLVEEIARHIGYESIPSVLLPWPISMTDIHSYDPMTSRISSFFSDRGYHDVYTYPFTLKERFSRFSENEAFVVENTSENRTHLRAHLAENMLELVANNYRIHSDGAFFEFGSIFDVSESLQGVWVLWWKKYNSLQTDLESYVKTFFGWSVTFQKGESQTKLFAPNAYANIIDADSEVLVRFWLIRPTLLPLFDIQDISVYGFEIAKLPVLHRPMRFTPLIEFPGTRRELNFIIPEDTPVAIIVWLVGDTHTWISDVGVSEIYRDEMHIWKDKKSVVVSFLLRNNSATITDEEASIIQDSIISVLLEKWYPLRGV